MNRRWICNDVWMDILPSFDHAQLGLKLALLSDRFDVLVDTHFDGKSELTIWRRITIHESIRLEPKVSVRIVGNSVHFPLPDRLLPNKIRFKNLRIKYIDHSIIAFLRSNKQIWDRNGTQLDLVIANVPPLWDVFIRQIWPIFATNIRHLYFSDADVLDNLRHRISPTILTDLDHLNSIDSDDLFPDQIADDAPNATAGQALAKWLHTPRKDGQPKQLFCWSRNESRIKEWVNNYKETFLRATTSSSYIIQLIFHTIPTPTARPFELVNEGTNEKLTLMRDENGCGKFSDHWLLKRCPIIVWETATVQRENDGNWDNNLNNVKFNLWRGIHCIGPLLSPEEEEADV